jgi:phage head maturation protease
VNDLAIAMERGDINEMSFAYRIVKESWLTEDGDEVPWWDMSGIYRHIKEVSMNKGDVSAVNYGANPYTDAALRSAIAAGLIDIAAMRRAVDEDHEDDTAALEAEARRIDEHNQRLAAFYAKRQTT